MTAKQAIAARFLTIAQCGGISAIKVTLLGRFLHIDFTRDADELRLRALLAPMKPASIQRLPGDANGVHLDGGTSHRLVAKL